MRKRERLEKLERQVLSTGDIYMAWSEEERQALIEKYGEAGCIVIHWDIDEPIREAVSDEPKSEN